MPARVTHSERKVLKVNTDSNKKKYNTMTCSLLSPCRNFTISGFRNMRKQSKIRKQVKGYMKEGVATINRERAKTIRSDEKQNQDTI